ncbi:MAG TPA: transcriptional repressor, partial [Candidatus Binatia bacterium]|nr:transcriptional repressor [Candidatus Binatia bacterium]
MKNNLGKASESSLSQRLVARGFRPTSQRQHVYEVLAGQRDHPTAELVFMRAKKGMPEISMATVYNCLDTLVKTGLVREVNVDPSAMR